MMTASGMTEPTWQFGDGAFDNLLNNMLLIYVVAASSANAAVELAVGRNSN